jgi:F-type H+-transporting ATPase subunit a
VRHFCKIFFVGAFIAVICAAGLKAQTQPQTPVVQPATATEAQGQAAAPEEETLPPQASPVLFHIGIFPISNSIVCSWIVAAIILVVVRVTTWKNIKEVPTGMQNFMEFVVEGWDEFMKGVLDERVTRWVFPFATTFLIFIIMCNYVDLVPGVGTIGYGTPDKNSVLPFAIQSVHTPFFRPPTTDANLTVAMTLVFLVMSMFWAIRYNGIWGFTKHVFGVKMKVGKAVYPIMFLLFLFIGLMEAVSILFARPVALAMRLFGNIFAGSTMLDMGFHLHSWLGSLAITIIVYFYETFVCAVQAFVFGLLVVAFVATMCSHQEEEGH